ncbi:MAG: ABC transporter substrate-binding protein [Cryobacterium sp.]
MIHPPPPRTGRRATRTGAAPTLTVSTLTVLALTVLTGCAAVAPGTLTSADALTAAPSAAPTAPPTAPPAVVPTGDGVLRIGTIFPMTGDFAANGAAQVAGTQLAAREIAEQGGVPGHTVELIHRNVGADPAVAVADLLARGVDVVFWDAATTPSDELAASVTGAGPAFLALGDFANGGTPLGVDAAFATRLRTADPALIKTAGAAEAYDGLVVTALAAVAVNDDAAASLEVGWDRVAHGPAGCASWGECALALAENQSVEYVGVTGRRS